MAEFPALPIFTDAYLSDTRHLSTLQHGAYLLMLMTAWRSSGCFLPDDDVYLARISGLDKRTWMANKAILLGFWHRDDQQNWVQGRLLDERNFVKKVRSQNVAAGKASALKRLNRASTRVATKPQQEKQQEPHIEPNGKATPTPSPSQEVDISIEDISTAPQRAKSRGSRIPDGFKPDGSCSSLADDLKLNNSSRKNALENFIDYWKGVPGQKGCKLDWQATFRNQLRRIAENSGGKNERNNDKPTRKSSYELLAEANGFTRTEGD